MVVTSFSSSPGSNIPPAAVAPPPSRSICVNWYPIMVEERKPLSRIQASINSDESTPLLADNHDGGDDVPRDKFWLAYWIMFMFGLVTLLPWHVFLTVEPYLRKQLYSYPYVGKHIVNFVGIAMQFPAAVVLFLNTYIIKKFSERARMLVPLVTILLLFSVAIVMAWLDMDDYQLLFLILTVASVFLINVAASVYQGGVFAISSRFPLKYRQAVMSGTGLGGLIAAIGNLVSLMGAGGPEHLTRQQLAKGAAGYFMAATAITVLAACGYLYMYRLEFVRHFPQREEMRRQAPGSFFSHLGKVLKRMWHMALSTFLVFVVTLTIYPALGAKILSVMELPGTCNNTQNGTDDSGNGSISNPSEEAWVCTYFQPVVCFLMFNFTSFIGRTLPAWLRKPGPRYLLVLVVLRFLLIALYAFCKYSADHRPYFNSDVAPMVLIVVTGVTNGYCNTLAFMYAPTLVDDNDVETAGAIMAASEGVSSIAGVSLGLLLTDLYVDTLQNRLPLV